MNFRIVVTLDKSNIIERVTQKPNYHRDGGPSPQKGLVSAMWNYFKKS